MKGRLASSGGTNTQTYPENTVAVLGAEIADEQPPGKLAGSQQVGYHVADEPPRLPQWRFGRVDRDRMIVHPTLETVGRGVSDGVLVHPAVCNGPEPQGAARRHLGTPNGGGMSAAHARLVATGPLEFQHRDDTTGCLHCRAVTSRD